MKYDIGLITKYVLEYDAGIPKTLAFGLSVAICTLVLVLSVVKADNPILVRRVSWSLLIVYVLLVLCFTVFFREGKDVAQISMKPLCNYESLNYKMIAESILNVFLFMPLGFLASAAVKNRRILNVLGIGLLISFPLRQCSMYSDVGFVMLMIWCTMYWAVSLAIVSMRCAVSCFERKDYD